MAHIQQKAFCEYVKAKYPDFFKFVNVVDIGSMDINGNNRYLFDQYSYTGVDIGEGENVDVVCLGHEYNPMKHNRVPFEKVDVVISTECFEHDKFWQLTLLNCVNILRSGGLFLFTCATTGRPEHGTTRSLAWASPHSHVMFDEYYQNLTEEDVRKVLDVDALFSHYEFRVNTESHDLYFYGIKK